MTFDEMIAVAGISGIYHNHRLAEPANVILRRPESFRRALEILRDPNTTGHLQRKITGLFTPNAYGMNLTFQQAVADSLELVNELMDYILDSEISEKCRAPAVYILGTLFLDYGRLFRTVRDSDFYVRLMHIYDVSPSCFADILHSRLLLTPFEHLYFLWGCLLSLARETKSMDKTDVPACWSSELNPEPGCITKFRDQEINPAAFAMILDILRKDDSPLPDYESEAQKPTIMDPDFIRIVRDQSMTIMLHYCSLKFLKLRGQKTESDCYVTLRALARLDIKSCSNLAFVINDLLGSSPFIGSPLNHMCMRYMAELMTNDFLEKYFSLVVDTIHAQFYIQEEWEENVRYMLAENDDPWLLWSLRSCLPNQFGRTEAISLAKSVFGLEAPKVDEFRKSMIGLVATCWRPSNTRSFNTQLIALAQEIGKSDSDAKYEQFFDQIVTPFYEDNRFSTDFSFEGCPLIDSDTLSGSCSRFLNPYLEYLDTLSEE